MKKMILFFAAFCIVQSLFCAELTAKFVTVEAGKKDTVENSMDKVRKAIYSSSQVDSSSVYMTREERIEQGNEY